VQKFLPVLEALGKMKSVGLNHLPGAWQAERAGPVERQGTAQ
jgi:hypothetical protein